MSSRQGDHHTPAEEQRTPPPRTLNRYQKLAQRAICEADAELLVVAADDAEETGDLKAAECYRALAGDEAVLFRCASLARCPAIPFGASYSPRGGWRAHPIIFMAARLAPNAFLLSENMSETTLGHERALLGDASPWDWMQQKVEHSGPGATGVRWDGEGYKVNIRLNVELRPASSDFDGGGDRSDQS